MLETLLRTKLYIPPLRPNLVPRSRLIEQLNQGLQLGHKLTLISAPAGFGKTTLASEWIAGCELPAAWLSLDEGDNGLTRFLTYFVAALQTIAASSGEGVLGMLQSPQPPPTESILTALINDISSTADDFVLVLDDYHVIDVQPVDKALTFLLEHLPRQMHLVIATREDPPLPLARYRARNELTELRVAELRFTSAEAAVFLNQVMGLNLSAEDITTLESRTEGWIAGLQLAALSIQGHKDATSLINAFAGSHRFVLDYLIEEVIEQQPESIQVFLLQTAVLERLNGSLCNAVTGQNNGQATLEMLERANLFIVALDNERRWYRYHHLFADLLRQRLRQTYLEQIPTLHTRASDWYERDGVSSDAIRHALAANDFERAADLAERAWPEMQGSYQSIAWLGWVETLPNELVRARPVLSIGYAWAFLNSGQMADAEARLRDVERMLEPAAGMSKQREDSATKIVVVDEEQFQALPVSLAAARAYHAQATGDLSGTVKYTQRVLSLIPEDDQQWRGAASSLLGLALYASGELEAAHRNLSDGMAGMDPLEAITGTFVLADIKMAQGQLRAAKSEYERALRLVIKHGEPMPLGTEDLYTGISKVQREQGNLEAAAQALATSKKLGEQIELPDWQHRWCIAQARLNETLGDLNSAFDLLNEAERSYVRTPVPELQPIAAMQARVWVGQDKIAEANDWARERNLSIDDELSYLREFEHITLARVLINRNRIDRMERSAQEAVSLIERLLQAAEAGKRMGSVIEILVLQALAHHVQGNIQPALEALERALIIAQPEGYVRIFVDEGLPMAQLLVEAEARGIMPDYSGELLAAFAAPEQKSEDKPYPPPAPPIQPLFEPLSQRELEVLNLIAQGLSNREIGQRLFLALNTVKGHNRNIFDKLQVHRRTEAVARARALGLL